MSDARAEPGRGEVYDFDTQPTGAGDGVIDVVKCEGPAHAIARDVRIVQAVCFSIAALEGYDVQSLGVTAPAMGAVLHIPRGLISIAASGTMAAMGLGAAAGGWLADRFGQRLMLLISVLTFGLASLLNARVFNAESLILARIFTGLGLGGAMPILIAITGDASPPQSRSTAIAGVSAGLPLGAALCGLVDLLGFARLGWQGVFLVGGGLTLAVLPLIALTIPGRRAAALVAGERPSVMHLFSQRRWRASLSLWVAIALVMTVLSAMTNWLPTLMIRKGHSHADASLAAVIYNGTGVFGGLVIGRLIDRIGFLRPLLGAFLALAMAVAALAALAGAGLLFAAASATGFCCCGAQLGLYALFPSYYSSSARATGSGAGVAAGRIGSVTGPGLVGLLLAHGATSGQVVTALIPAVGGAAAAVILLALFARPFNSPGRDLRHGAATQDG